MDGTEEPALASGASVDELVPGSVAGILDVAESMSELGDVLLDAATTLSRVEVTGWYGAASVAAHGRLGQEPARWSGASGAFLTAAGALRRYAAALAPAREMAEHAVEAYRRYLDLVRVLEVATSGAVPSTGGTTAVPGSGRTETSGPDRAQLGHRAAVLLAAAHGQTAAAAMAALGPLGGDLPGLAYAADALRRQAISLLVDARAQVLAAGDAAADAVQAATADAPQARTFWQGTIRRPGAEDVGHATLDLAGWVPGWVGMGATALNVGWYALEGDRENAGYAAMGFVPMGMGKLGREISAGSKAFQLTSKADVLALTDEDLATIAPSLGLSQVAPGVFRSPGGLTLGWMGEEHRVTHVLRHFFAETTKPTHSVFSIPIDDLVPTLDEAWAKRGVAEPDDPFAYVVDLHRPIGTSGETSIRLVVRALEDGTVNKIVTAYPY